MKKKMFILALFALALAALPLMASPAPVFGQPIAATRSQPAIVPVSLPAGALVEASAYPSQAIVSGDLTVSMPALEERLASLDQSKAEAASLHRYLQSKFAALFILELLILAAIGFCLYEFLAFENRIKVLEGVEVVSDAAKSAGSSGEKPSPGDAPSTSASSTEDIKS